MHTGSSHRGKSFKYSSVSAISKPDPRAIYERDQEIRNKWFTVADGNIVFDFGAEYGHWTMSGIAQGAEMVYAIEPDPAYIAALRANIATNSFTDRCSIIRRNINLDEFIDGLSVAPARVSYIRLAEGYTAIPYLWIDGAVKTVRTFKPRMIAWTGGDPRFVESLKAHQLDFAHRTVDGYTMFTFK